MASPETSLPVDAPMPADRAREAPIAPNNSEGSVDRAPSVADAGHGRAGGSLVVSRLRPADRLTDTAHGINRAAPGRWRITGYAEARALMLADPVQAGFNADLVLRMPRQMVPPVLYQHGDTHRQQRSDTARYFSPAATSQKHAPRMAVYAHDIISAFERSGRADLRELSSQMALAVAADVVGLTDSPRKPMGARLDAILHADIAFSLRPRKLLNYVRVQLRVLAFYVRDVRPAIRARQKQPADDVISHLLAKGRRGPEILAECIMYGAAGMVTTQEFICVVVWQCLRQPELAAVMRSDDRDARYRLLNELLRLDPVVRRLHRRLPDALTIDGRPAPADVRGGELVEVDVVAANLDPSVVGEEPHAIDHDRELPRGVPRSVLGFGAGGHRCAGEFIALAETDIFVRRLLQVPGLTIEREPTIVGNDHIESYELRDFIVRCEPGAP